MERSSDLKKTRPKKTSGISQRIKRKGLRHKLLPSRKAEDRYVMDLKRILRWVNAIQRAEIG